MKRLSVVMIMVIVLSALLTACGGSGGAGPAAAAKSFFDAFTELDFAKMKDLTCEAQKSTMDEAANAMSALGDSAALKELLKIDTSGLKYEEKSVSGDKATVVVTGKIKVEAMGQSQDQDMNEDVPMVMEGGAWKVCAAGGVPIQ